jgi:hypothetical protein
MAGLVGIEIEDGYGSLLNTGNLDVGLSSSLVTVNDGNGAAAAYQVSTLGVNFTGFIQNNGFTITNLPACRVATTTALTVTYSNGTLGVGATLTNAGTQVAIVIDGVTLALGDRVLVQNQSSTFQNGVYTATALGSGSSNWVLTRAADFDQAAQIVTGATVQVTSGTANAGIQYYENGAGPFTVGTTAITFAAIAGSTSLVNPMTTLGDIIYENSTPAATRLAGNTTSTKKFLTQTGTGSASAAPGWNTIATGDVPTLNQNTSGSAASLSATLIVAQGGTGLATTTAYAVFCGGTTSTGNFQQVSGLGTSGQVLTSNGAAALPTWQPAGATLAKVTTYNGIATAGNGVGAIVANADLTSQSGAATVTTYTAPASNGTYRVGGYLNITAVTLDVIQLQVAWTDETNASRTQIFFPMGTTVAGIGATGFTPFPTADIRVKASTTITVSTVLTTGSGSIGYDVGASIMQLA